MAQREHEFRIYIQDSDTSERLGGTVYAKSQGHARQLWQQQASGLKITRVEQTSAVVIIVNGPTDRVKVRSNNQDAYWRD